MQWSWILPQSPPLPPSADAAIFPVQPGGLQQRALPQRVARLYPLQRHKVQQRRLPPVDPLHTAVLGELPVCKSTLLGGNTPISRVTLQRENRHTIPEVRI